MQQPRLIGSSDGNLIQITIKIVEYIFINIIYGKMSLEQACGLKSFSHVIPCQGDMVYIVSIYIFHRVLPEEYVFFHMYI
jgi:hypothetical protein